MTNNKKVLDFINETKELCNPAEIVWIDGSEEQLEALREQAVKENILIKLNQEKLPDHRGIKAHVYKRFNAYR